MKGSEQALVKQHISQMRITITDSKFNKTPPYWRLNKQIINHSKLYYIIAGEGYLQIDGEEVVIRKGDFLYIPEGCKLSYHASKDNPLVKYWCNFKVTLGSGSFSEYIQMPYRISVGEEKWLEERFESLVKLMSSSDPFSPMAAKSVLFEIFYSYIQRVTPEGIELKDSQSSTDLNKVLVYMDQNMHNKITLATLAEIVNVHPNYMIKLFKSKFGVAPIEYLNTLRVARAKELIELGNHTVSEISDRCGFNNQYYFSQVFKKQVGLSPTGYRMSVCS